MQVVLLFGAWRHIAGPTAFAAAGDTAGLGFLTKRYVQKGNVGAKQYIDRTQDYMTHETVCAALGDTWPRCFVSCTLGCKQISASLGNIRASDISHRT